MKVKAFFQDIPQIGDLYLEHVLLSFENEPILFVSSNEKSKIFLCFCSEIRGIQRWVVSESSIVILKDLINREIDIYSALGYRTDEFKYIIELKIDGSEECKPIQFNDIDELDLPTPHVYLEYFDKDLAYDFIKNYEAMIGNKMVFEDDKYKMTIQSSYSNKVQRTVNRILERSLVQYYFLDVKVVSKNRQQPQYANNNIIDEIVKTMLENTSVQYHLSDIIFKYQDNEQSQCSLIDISPAA